MPSKIDLICGLREKGIKTSLRMTIAELEALGSSRKASPVRKPKKAPKQRTPVKRTPSPKPSPVKRTPVHTSSRNPSPKRTPVKQSPVRKSPVRAVPTIRGKYRSRIGPYEIPHIDLDEYDMDFDEEEERTFYTDPTLTVNRPLVEQVEEKMQRFYDEVQVRGAQDAEMRNPNRIVDFANQLIAQLFLIISTNKLRLSDDERDYIVETLVERIRDYMPNESVAEAITMNLELAQEV